MKAVISSIIVPNVSWEKYVVKRNGIIISRVFYDRKDAQAFRDIVNGRN